MSDKRELLNVVGGASVAATDGRTTDLVNPTTGEVYATAPLSSAGDVDRAYAAAAEAFDGVARQHPVRAAEGDAGHRRPARGARRRAGRPRVGEHRQAAGAHRVGGDPADDRPDPVLRGCRAAAGGQGRRRVHGRSHLDHPPRADRRHRSGHALELPDDDGGLEVRPGHRRGQRRRPEALRHDAGLDRPHGPAHQRGRAAPARRLQRRLWRPRHRSCPRRAPDAADGGHHRVGPRRHGGRRSPRLST